MAANLGAGALPIRVVDEAALPVWQDNPKRPQRAAERGAPMTRAGFGKGRSRRTCGAQNFSTQTTSNDSRRRGDLIVRRAKRSRAPLTKECSQTAIRQARALETRASNCRAVCRDTRCSARDRPRAGTQQPSPETAAGEPSGRWTRETPRPGSGWIVRVLDYPHLRPRWRRQTTSGVG